MYGWAMPQKFPVNDFKWVEETSKFKEDIIKSYNAIMMKVMKNIFWKFMFNILYLHNLHNDLLFLPERMKILKSLKACS